MSDVEDDLTFYEALEDELYKDSDDSNDEIDSDIEAELYQSVHFASSLIQAPNEKDATSKALPHSTQDIKAENIILCGEEASTDQIDGEQSVFFVDKQGDVEIINKYPEMKSVFSNTKKPRTISSQAIKLNLHDAEGDLEQEKSLDNNWDVDHADKAVNQTTVKKPRRAYVRCFNCNERGHRTFECNKEKKDQVCYLCGKIGHIRQRCPNDVCFNCQEPGHQMKKCKKSRCHPRDSCNRCHASGHHEHSCPDKWRQYHITTSPGEIISPKQGYKRSGSIYCYNCGDKGHLGYECWKQGDKGGYFCTAFPFVVKYDNEAKVSNPCTSRIQAQIKNGQNDGTTPKVKYPTHISEQLEKKPGTPDAPLSKKRKKARKKERLGNAEAQPHKRLKLDDGAAVTQQFPGGNRRKKEKRRILEEWQQDPCDMLKQQVHDGHSVFWNDSDLIGKPSANMVGQHGNNRAKPVENGTKTVTITGNALQITFANEHDQTTVKKSKKQRKKKNTQQEPFVPMAQPREMLDKPKKKRKRKKNKTMDLTNCGPDMPILGLNTVLESGPTFPTNKINKPKIKRMNKKARLKVGFV